MKKISLFVLFLFLTSNSFSAEFYVALDGSDENPGTFEKPLNTLLAARNAVRELNSGACNDKITVFVREGHYPFDSTLELSAIDSGQKNAPIVYKAYQGEKVTFGGGPIFDSSLFKPITDKNIKNRIIDEAVRNKVIQVDLVKAGIDSDQIGPMIRFGHAPLVYGNGPTTAPSELFFDSKPMTVARWPNEGFVKIEEVLRCGSKPRSHRRDVNADFKTTGPTYIPGVFRYSGDRPKYWLEAREVWLHGYWARDWSDDCMSVAYIDTDKREITLSAPHEYGIEGAWGQGERYYALNMLEEIDIPGEYYIDPYIGILYFYPPTSNDANPHWGVSLIDEPLIRLNEVSYIKFEGITFEMCRDDAIIIEGGNNNTVAGCTIRNSGNWAVKVLGGYNHIVQSCDIYNVGRGGIKMTGGNQQNLTSAYHKAMNNHIHHFSRRAKTYQFALAINGVGITASNNLIHDAPHVAIDYRGNFNIIELNEVYRVCTESDDAGVINSDRDYSIRGNVVRHNYFHDIRDIRPEAKVLGNHMIYFDSCTSGDTVTGNIFRNGGRDAININGGRDMTIKNNIFMDLGNPVRVAAIGFGGHKSAMITAYNTMTEKIDPNSKIWKTKFPKLVNYTNDWDELAIPKGNIISDNLFVRTKTVNIVPHPKFPANTVKLENNTVTDKSPFANTEKHNLQLQKSNSIVQKLQWLKTIPFDKIGLYKDEYRKNLPKN